MTGRLTGSFVVPDSVAGQDLEGKIECYGRENLQSDEVLLFRGTTSFAASLHQENQLNEFNWESGADSVSEIPPEFDRNRNGRTNWTDLLDPLCNPAPQASPLVIAPETVGESGSKSGFTRSFIVVENRSADEALHFDLDVEMAPGVEISSRSALNRWTKRKWREL